MSASPEQAVPEQSRVIGELPFTIHESGRYVLTSNLYSEDAGIIIEADDVEVDFQGHTLFGSESPENQFLGVYALDRNHIVLRNGKIKGFHYAVYFRSSLYGVKEEPIPTGFHTIEHMDITKETFRGIRVEGIHSVVRNNRIRYIGGSTAYENAFAMGIEAIGQGAMIKDNVIFEVRSYTPVSPDDTFTCEGVGICLSNRTAGSIVSRNFISNSYLKPTQDIEWVDEGNSTYGIWVGANNAIIPITI